MKIERVVPSGFIAAAIATIMVLGFVTPASASSSSATERVNRALAAAGVPKKGASTVSVGAEGISLQAEFPSAKIKSNGKSVAISLEAKGSQAVSVDASTRIFGQVARDTDALVRKSDGGVQIISVMQSSAAPARQRYKVELAAGEKLIPAGSGFEIVDSDGHRSGAIEAPWAKDATGKSLPTRYLLEGDTLIQETRTAEAVFPVVADPKLTYGVGVYLNMWGYEVRAYAIAIIGLGGVTFVAACTSIGSIPNPALKTVATLICGAASVNLTKVWTAMVDTYYTTTINDSSCYQQKIVPAVASKLTIVSSSNCL
ncbi:hypothetical protein ACN267_13000 [Micromonospora sp. WMMD734]|uniref:hypothetical protein n=1 Tax=Micromonospora sp. WMMD734 TaxID=3404129 RepID=UPI003B930B2C